MTNDPYNSVLQSVKKLLGIAPTITDFDPDVIASINACIFSLKQLGVEPIDNNVVCDVETTFQDLFGEEDPDADIAAIKQYMYCRTRLIFDPPQASSLLQAIKDQIHELEWRLRQSVENYQATLEEVEANAKEMPNVKVKEIWDSVMEEADEDDETSNKRRISK